MRVVAHALLRQKQGPEHIRLLLPFGILSSSPIVLDWHQKKPKMNIRALRWLHKNNDKEPSIFSLSLI